MLDRVFMAVLDMSKTASLVIAVILLGRLLLKKAPKVFSYVLWAAVLFRLLCPVTLETRVSGALNNILGIYGIGEDLRKSKIQRVFDLDYRKLGIQTLQEFHTYVQEATDQAFLDLLKR